ncbi:MULTISPECIES: hypothetical protein [Actinomycetes]|uniref:Uncharacterized protein n=1 Tax=Streptomyces gilvosporeus TaxID=553510 RepID=A0A1V0TTA8_9ACTN|nr:hypothetical protein [Streptomyces gilvosporeus]ARF55998.1 hypothetical protein B1H19_19010 [Streptomyces gilvosporeus]
MRYEITAPCGREGIVAGVAFTAGRALVEDPPAGALLYFRRHGYTVTPLDVPEPESVPIGFAADSDPAPAKPAPRARGKQRTDTKGE